MSHAFVTVAMPFDNARVDAVEAYLDMHLGNPVKPAVRAAIDATGIVHFISIIVVPGATGVPANLLLEASCDGNEPAALRAIADALPQALEGVLDAAGIRRGAALDEFLRGHALTLGQAWWHTLGLPIAGTIGLSVWRIRSERDLAVRIAAILDELPRGLSPFERLERVRNVIWNAGDAKWAFAPEPARCLEAAPDSGLTPLVKPFFGEVIGNKPFELLAALRTARALAASAFVNMLWPLVLAYAVVVAALWYGFGARAAAIFVAVSVLVAPVAIAAIAGFAYYALRRRETRDRSVDREPGDAFTADIMRHETFGAQNLLFAVSTLKRGSLRRLLLRFGMWSVGTVPLFCRPGFLGSNRMIHFARWMVVPGTDKLLFLSNYDGTWAGYVGDFVQNAAGAHGVTSLWSNCAEFPRTHDLIFGGDDRDRLVRWARRQQRPVHFWYSAYPDITTDRFRTNAAIRQGLASAHSAQDAADWLACFGSAPRPPESLEVAEIPALAFSGLGALAHSARITIAFSRDSSACRDWLADLEPRIGWGESIAGDSTLAVALAASALCCVGLPEDDLATFPVAFQQGMAAPDRARALGDVGDQAPGRWEWGGPASAVDALVMLYAKSAGALDALERFVRDVTHARGHAAGATLRLTEVPPQGTYAREAFGFVDGVSQPRMRGTQHAQSRKRASNDLVAPGEITLGYPDNQGRFAPTPSVAARIDPRRLLPDVDTDPHRQRPEFARSRATGRRDIGRNGTYLVVRQLDQHAHRFERWLDDATASTAGSALPADAALRREMIAAKMVGRWRNGTSLARYPDAPGKHFDPARNMLVDAPPDNEFMYGDQDPAATRCPFGAHIRRANPRDGLTPGSKEQHAVVNSHRILRVGRSYPSQAGGPGLLFMCVNADIERQFEFIQQSWLLNPSFSGLERETDPLPGHETPPRVLTIATEDGPLRLRGMSDFVRMRGGGYFFMPGRAAYHFLATLGSR